MRTDFELPLQKRKSKMMITEDIINRVPCTHIIDNGGVIDKALQLQHKKLLYESMRKNQSNEVGYLININTWEKIVIYGDEKSISLQSNKEARLMLSTSPDLSLIFLHNHPNNSLFSYADLRTFSMNRSIYIATAISNNSNIHIIKKGLNFNAETVGYTYNQYVEENKGVKYILQHSKFFGFEYKYGRCKNEG